MFCSVPVTSNCARNEVIRALSDPEKCPSWSQKGQQRRGHPSVQAERIRHTADNYICICLIEVIPIISHNRDTHYFSPRIQLQFSDSHAFPNLSHPVQNAIATVGFS